MIEFFHGDSESEHEAFQLWRRTHPDGFHLTDKGAKIFSAHWTQDKRESPRGRGCIHQGTSNVTYMEDTGSCYTKAKKVCSISLQELHDWAASEGMTIKNCAHCDTKKFPFPVVATGRAVRSIEKPSLPAGNKNPPANSSSVVQYVRDELVRRWVLSASNGYCESCGCPAPFNDVDGQPYLEVHHVRRLSDGGSDTVSNTVALCPNCHRQLHHGIDAPLLATRLYAQVHRLVRE